MSFLHDLPIADLIAHYGYLAIFVIITLESAGLPLPGETVLLTSAAYAGSTGNINIAIVVAIAATAAILGDNAGYWVGRRWGLPLLLRKGHLIGLDHGRLKLGQYLFRRHGGKIVFFGRFTAMLRAYAAVLAGVNKLDARRFMAFNALGGVAWASIMGFGAYLCGRSIENVMGPVGLGLLAFVLLGAVALWLFMRRHEARLMVAAEAEIPGPLGGSVRRRPSLSRGLSRSTAALTRTARSRQIFRIRSRLSWPSGSARRRRPPRGRPPAPGARPGPCGSRSPCSSSSPAPAWRYSPGMTASPAASTDSSSGISGSSASPWFSSSPHSSFWWSAGDSRARKTPSTQSPRRLLGWRRDRPPGECGTPDVGLTGPGADRTAGPTRLGCPVAPASCRSR